MSNQVEEVVFGGGCFWCTEAVFSKLRGVVSATPGYTAGKVKNPTYREVCSGLTGHNEVVKIVYEPSVIGFEQLLEVFFSTHDPTSLNRQGNDVGTQYRSGIYFTNEEQAKQAREFMSGKAQAMWTDPIVTELEALNVFYEAEDYHHNYFEKHPEQGYCQVIINPKLQKLKLKYSELLKDGK